MPRRGKQILAILAFSVFLCGYGVLAWQASFQAPQANQRQNGNEYQQNTHLPINRLRSVGQQSANSSGGEASNSEESVINGISEFFSLKLTDCIIAIFTIVLAVKTSGLFRETSGLRESTHKLWQETKILADAAKTQSQDMKSSIKAAQDSANAAKSAADALPILERAYIHRGEITNNLQVFLDEWVSYMEESNPEFYFSVTNYGRTPGIIVGGQTEFEISEYMPAKLDIVTSGDTTYIVLGAGKDFRFPIMQFRRNFTSRDAANVSDGKRFVYCHGWLRYTDIFGNVRTSTYCLRYVPLFDMFVPDGGDERNHND